MKTKILIPCVVLAAVMAWIYIQPSSTEDETIFVKVEPAPIRQNIIEDSDEKPNETKSHPLEIFLSSVAKIAEFEDIQEDQNIFSNEQSLRQAGSVIDKSIKYLNPERGRANFHTSGIDTIVNYSASLAQLMTSYNKENDKEYFRQRVTALRFIELTQHLKLKDCLRLIDHLAQLIDQEASAQLQRNAKLDLYEMAQICGRIDSESTSTLANNLTNAIARNTILFGLKRISDD